jgi:hypothetical protein
MSPLRDNVKNSQNQLGDAVIKYSRSVERGQGRSQELNIGGPNLKSMI